MKKQSTIKNNNLIKILISGIVIASTGFLSACNDDDPKKENIPEIITKVTLTFTPAGGGSSVEVTATDPDGAGVQDIQADGPINLLANTGYNLTITLINGLAKPTDPEYNVTEEVEEEADEHLFFFEWTNGIFSSPAGNGNMDNRSDAVNYNDQDANGLPLGLETSWITGSASSGNYFRVVLKHQPGLKSASSTSSAGETDLDVEFELIIN